MLAILPGSSRADAVGMIQNRHPTIAATIVRALEIGSPVPTITAVVGCIAVLKSLIGNVSGKD